MSKKSEEIKLQDINFDELPDYSSILTKLKDSKRTKHLLLGNGFSMAYDKTIFSYNALHNFIEKLNDPLLNKLFDILQTKNFEQAMRLLDNFIELADEFGSDKNLIQQLKTARTKLEHSLIDAVSELHPEHVFKISEEKSEACFKFLKEYLDNGGMVFSTNYDLLLYWVVIRNDSQNAIDGFGKELLNPNEVRKGEEQEWSDLYWGKNREEQSVFYLHGALPFFDTGIEIEKEVYKDTSYLLENIKERMRKKDYPVFVTAGSGDEKLNQIMHNKYLIYCYDQLCQIQGSLITIGFNFGEYDEHIIDAINKAAKHGAKTGDKLFSIYIGVYSESSLDHIKKIAHKFKCKVNVFNSGTANIWS